MDPLIFQNCQAQIQILNVRFKWSVNFSVSQFVLGPYWVTNIFGFEISNFFNFLREAAAKTTLIKGRALYMTRLCVKTTFNAHI